MKKIIQQKYAWVFFTACFIALVYLANLVSFRADLTAEKRFSLSPSTHQVLKGLDSAVTITVFLTGDLPSDYRKLNQAVQDLLNEFKSIAGGNILQVKFEKPGEHLRSDTSKAILYDSLSRLGVVFEQTASVSAESDKTTQQLIIPSALLQYKQQKPIAIDLRSSKKVFKQYDLLTVAEPEEDKEATRNAAEALLEYKFANAIHLLTRKQVPTIAYLVGNGEPIDLRINDLGERLRNEYRLAVFDLKQGYPDPAMIDAMLVVKPTQQFTEEDKLKLDQYVMNGGKVIWFIDKLYAELDSLKRNQAEYTAYDRGLDLDDLLFKYGVRINGDLLQDLNCSKMPIVIGQNADGSPKMQRVPWPYYPFLSARTKNPISQNLDRVLPLFPSSIDTVKAPGINKTILLATDSNSRRLSSPAMVSVNSVKDENDLRSFNKSYIPVAVLLEGRFQSLFKNRVSAVLNDSIQKATGKPFLNQAVKPGKQIVVADADIVTNEVSQTTGPLPMGELQMENYRFANREFLSNSVDYLVSGNQLFETRNKDFVLRLLDKKKLSDEKTFWQVINIGLPLVLVLILGVFFQWRRKSKYTA
ncbi:MAG: gliding motility-associated ABC transporter substrate-binding protein GldG [Chitinophagaceae bacterium BSSC1]|nr:MAG: gliding motility-associated ABC transporter substrate-binding protein GldG [Chitinophagaceae bacterium BSSC1]